MVPFNATFLGTLNIAAQGSPPGTSQSAARKVALPGSASA